MRRRSAVGALLLLALSLALGVALWRTRVRSGHSGDLEALRRRGVLRVGTSGDYAPFTLAQGPEITGLDAELATRAARDLGVRVEFVRFSWGNLLADLKAGRFDIGASGITLRPERALAPREVAQRMPDPAAFDRSDVRIAVNRGGYLERVAHRFFPHATILPTDDNRRLLDPVLGNGADAALSDSAEARGLAHPELVRLGPLTRDHKGLLVGERAPELADWLDDWLRARELDGFVSALRRKHLGDESATADMTVEAIVADVGLRMGLMPLVAAAKARKALPIEDRSQEARVLERIAATATRYAISPTDTRTLYDVLIRASKEVQRASSASAAASADVGPALDDLRDAIRRIDEHLMHSLRDAVEAGSTANFPALLQNSDLGDVSASTRADMAAALAKFTHAPH